MAILNIASKANQAALLPALLVASYANESNTNASIDIKFQEVELLDPNKETTLELILGSENPTYGSVHGGDEIISSLWKAYPFGGEKHQGLVCRFNPIHK